MNTKHDYENIHDKNNSNIMFLNVCISIKSVNKMFIIIVVALMNPVGNTIFALTISLKMKTDFEIMQKRAE